MNVISLCFSFCIRYIFFCFTYIFLRHLPISTLFCWRNVWIRINHHNEGLLCTRCIFPKQSFSIPRIVYLYRDFYFFHLALHLASTTRLRVYLGYLESLGLKSLCMKNLIGFKVAIYGKLIPAWTNSYNLEHPRLVQEIHFLHLAYNNI